MVAPLYWVEVFASVMLYFLLILGLNKMAVPPENEVSDGDHHEFG